MTATNLSEAAKAVVRRNTEEVRGSSTKFCGRHFPTFTPTSIGSLQMETA